jgi:transposase
MRHDKYNTDYGANPKRARREVHCRREIVFSVVDNGITWRALPADFPPWSTVYNYFAAWEAAGVTQDVLDGLRDRVRLTEGRTAAPSAAIIDSVWSEGSRDRGSGQHRLRRRKKINGRYLELLSVCP